MPVTSILATGALTTYAAAKAELSVIGAAIVDDTHQNLVERIINAYENECAQGEELRGT